MNNEDNTDSYNEFAKKELEHLMGSKDPLPPGWVDYNEIPLDKLVDSLERKYMLLSSGEAYIICKLIDFYKNINKKDWYIIKKTNCGATGNSEYDESYGVTPNKDIAKKIQKERTVFASIKKVKLLI